MGARRRRCAGQGDHRAGAVAVGGGGAPGQREPARRVDRDGRDLASVDPRNSRRTIETWVGIGEAETLFSLAEHLRLGDQRWLRRGIIFAQADPGTVAAMAADSASVWGWRDLEVASALAKAGDVDGPLPALKTCPAGASTIATHSWYSRKSPPPGRGRATWQRPRPTSTASSRTSPATGTNCPGGSIIISLRVRRIARQRGCGAGSDGRFGPGERDVRGGVAEAGKGR